MKLTKEKREKLKKLQDLHENIRNILIQNGSEEHGDCIIDEICIAVGIEPTTAYWDRENDCNYNL